MSSTTLSTAGGYLTGSRGVIVAFEDDRAVMVNERDPLNQEYEEAMR